MLNHRSEFMKTKALFLLALVFLTFSSQSMAKQSQKVAFLVRQTNHLKAAILTLEQMRKGKFPINYDSAVIVVCGGKGVNALKKESSMSRELFKSTPKNVEVKACGITLKKMNLKKEHLHSNVVIVENGLYEMIRLKTEGFISVDL
tara:strand:+ start:6870 stop:7307 length:438 start_codon:yes stop_codon:yes gene_type:complete